METILPTLAAIYFRIFSRRAASLTPFLSIVCVNLKLYKVVEDGTKSGEDTTEIKRYTDSIMETQDLINELNDKEDAHRFLLKEKTWLFKELENIGNEEGALYRDDIFKRIIKNGVIHPDNSITFHLIFGVSRHINR